MTEDPLHNSYPQLRVVGEFSTPYPAFLTLASRAGFGRADELYISSFGRVSPPEVRVAEGLRNPSSIQPTLLSSSLAWPNESVRAPIWLFGEDALIVAGGFIPFTTGAVSWIELGGEKRTIKLTVDKPAWFYHRTAFRDMNGDGRVDIVTARGYVPFPPGPGAIPRGELVWLEQPANWDHASPWTEHVLVQGPDVHFELVDLDHDGTEEIVAAQFFTGKLTIFWKTDSGYASRVIDSTIGPVFDVDVADLDLDGKKELLVTNHVNTAAASVYAYQFTGDFRTDAWNRHTLLTNIQTRQAGPGQASPGSAFAIRPRWQNFLSKPLIVVSGDGSQRLHVLTPVNQDRGDFQYTESTPLDVPGSVIGRPAFADVLGDSALEVFVPAYDAGKVYVLSFGNTN